jgi:gluconokinase
MKYILGIDIGTGSTKAVALDLKYSPVFTCQQHYLTSSPLPGYSEQDPEMIWQALVRCLNEMLNKQGALPLAIGFSSAMHSLIAVDELGNALAPMMTWADSRSAEVAEELRASVSGMNTYKISGTPLHAMSPLCKLIWMKRNQSGLFDKAHKFISIKEYIWYRLFNEFKIDHSIASATGLFDVEARIWSAAIMKMAGIDSERLSQPVGTGYTKRGLSPSAMVLFRLHDVPFVIGASDGCLANLGTFATEPGVAAVTIGTSGAVRVGSSRPVYSEAMTFSYVLDEQTYICGGPVNNGGIALQWLLRDILGKESLAPADYEDLFARVASIIPGSEGLLFLPYLNGERAPIWDVAGCGTFFGLRLHHNQAHLARAVLEGVCYALKDVLVALEESTGQVSQINVSGGFVRAPVWMQMLADITGKNTVLVQEEDASAIGAAYLAIKAIDLETKYPSLPAAEKQVIWPDAGNHEVYATNFGIYKQLYSDLRNTMQRLHVSQRIPK